MLSEEKRQDRQEESIRNEVKMRVDRSNGVPWEVIYKSMFPEPQQLGSAV